MQQPNFRGKKYRVQGGKLVPVSKKEKGLTLRQKQAQADIRRSAQKRWNLLLRAAREYTSKHRHVNGAELIVYFHYKKIYVPEATIEKLLAEIARDKKK